MIFFFFDIFFALAHKPFWSILHPNTFKNHPQLKLQEMQWKTKATQTRERTAGAQKMTSYLKTKPPPKKKNQEKNSR